MSRSELKSDIAEVLEDHTSVALCLDFDGTLAPIVSDPEEATLPFRTRKILATLSEKSTVDITIISGRALRDVRSRINIEGISYAGNHGLELLRDDHVWVHPDAEDCRESLERICHRLESELASISGCVIEDKYATAAVHYRRVDPEEIGSVIATVERLVDSEPTLRTTVSNKVVEIRPDTEYGKGAAVEALAETGPNTLVSYLGDAETDVDAFRTLAAMKDPTIRVSVGETLPASEYVLETPADVRELLEWLLKEHDRLLQTRN